MDVGKLTQVKQSSPKPPTCTGTCIWITLAFSGSRSWCSRWWCSCVLLAHQTSTCCVVPIKICNPVRGWWAFLSTMNIVVTWSCLNSPFWDVIVCKANGEWTVHGTPPPWKLIDFRNSSISTLTYHLAGTYPWVCWLICTCCWQGLPLSSPASLLQWMCVFVCVT